MLCLPNYRIHNSEGATNSEHKDFVAELGVSRVPLEVREPDAGEKGFEILDRKKAGGLYDAQFLEVNHYSRRPAGLTYWKLI